MEKKIGAFIIKDGQISGPADYMKEQGSALLQKILKAKDEVFNMTCHLSPDVETAIGVRMQTDYAGWHGMKSFASKLK